MPKLLNFLSKWNFIIFFYKNIGIKFSLRIKSKGLNSKISLLRPLLI